jgi:hypothetical protein
MPTKDFYKRELIALRDEYREMAGVLRELYVWANTNDPGDAQGNDTAPLERSRQALSRARSRIANNY